MKNSADKPSKITDVSSLERRAVENETGSSLDESFTYKLWIQED